MIILLTILGEPRVLKKHTECVNTVAWNPTSNLLASASDDGTAIIWSGDQLQNSRVLSATINKVIYLKISFIYIL